MNHRLSIVFASTVLIVPPLLAGCGADDDSASSGAGASAAGAGAAPISGGSMPGGSGGGSGTPGSAGFGAASAAGAPGGGSAAGSSGASAVAGVSGGGSAAGSSGAGDAIPATFATIKLVLGGGGGIMPCAAAPCHGVGGVAPPGRPLELPPNDDAKLYANLTTYVSTACSGNKLVTPGDPGRSALVSILSGPCGKTPRMPYGCSADAGDCIPDEYIAAVRAWIGAGAPGP